MSAVWRAVQQVPTEQGEVWVAPDDACRWKQSAGEVVVQVVGLPRGVRGIDLAVDLKHKHCKGVYANLPCVVIDGKTESSIVWHSGVEGRAGVAGGPPGGGY